METLFVDEEKYIDWFFGTESMRKWGNTLWEELSAHGKFEITVLDIWEMCEDIPANAILNRPKWWAEDNYLSDEDNMPLDFWETYDFELVRKGTLGYPTKEELE
tara:strand:- start:5676 stop:5987 length:312 start_codon:yes stop_codon:yes gene_type:complete